LSPSDNSGSITNFPSGLSTQREGTIPVEQADLYFRELGHGQPILILHGGPDFDHTYFLPELDRLSDAFRLIYYDQRGRGKSAANVQPEDVTIKSEVDDLEAVRKYFQLESVPVLGHSWGGVLAMEYALRYPERVSELILMNTAPASAADYMFFRQDRIKRAASDIEKLKARATDTQYQEGDPDTVARYYRIHFNTTLRQPEHLEAVIQRLRASFTKDGILKARAIEDRLMDQTWLSTDYDLLPALKHLRVPTLVIHGSHDLFPVECAVHIAEAIPQARFVLLNECGHFSFLECPNEVRTAIVDFFYSE
jgi:proline iminopeptidase